MRRIALLVAASLVAGGALVATAGVAAADPAAVTQVSTTDTGRVSVGLADSTALWVQVSVRASAADDAAVLFSTDHLSWGAGWVTDDPVQLPAGTAYGSYPVDVDYRLATGTVEHWSGAAHGALGLFRYARHVGIVSASNDRTETDLDHPTVTVSGNVTMFDPASGVSGPAGPGVQVSVHYADEAASTVHQSSSSGQTDADGNFSIPITPGGYLTSVTAQVAGLDADTVALPAVELPDVAVHATEVRLTAGPALIRVHAGKTFTVSGTAQRLTNYGWRPLVGARVDTANQTYNSYTLQVPGLMGHATTSSTGHFSYSVKATRTTDFFTFVHPSADVTEYPDGNVVDGHLNVPVAGSLLGVTFAIDEFRDVKVSGHLRLAACYGQWLNLMYSRNGTTGWTKIGATRATEGTGTTCSFTVKGVGGVDGYYRLVHTESAAMLAYTSAKHRLHRTQTRMTGFSISPTRTYRNAHLTAKGRLTQLVGSSWRAVGHGHVVLVFKPKGDTQWYWVVKGYTNSSGYYTLAGKAYGTGSWGVYYDADSTHYYSQTESRSVTVS